MSEDAIKEAYKSIRGEKGKIEIEKEYIELWNRLTAEVPKIAAEAMFLYASAKKAFKTLRDEVDNCNFKKVTEKLGDITAARQGIIELSETMHPESTALKEMNNELRFIHDNAYSLRDRFIVLCECKRKGEL